MMVSASSHTFTAWVLQWVVRHPVAAFLVWFFTIGQAIAFAPLVAREAYGATVPAGPFVIASTLIGLLLPTLAITWIADGSDGVRRLWRRICTVRAPLGWYALAVLGVPLATLGLTVALYGVPGQVTAGAVIGAVVYGLLVQTLLVLLTTNLWEEVAWTGFVQARLQDRYGPLRAALFTAPLFALQHVALVVDNPPLAALLVMSVITVLAIPFRALIGSAYNATGSLFVVGLVHAVGNGMTSGSNVGKGFLPRLYTGELIGVMHQLASAVLGIALIVATRGRLHVRNRPSGRDDASPASCAAQALDPRRTMSSSTNNPMRPGRRAGPSSTAGQPLTDARTRDGGTSGLSPRTHRSGPTPRSCHLQREGIDR